ncbi:MAG: hypothetical protein ACI9MC_002281 [Kiritimatiellia bacterium]|jgi:hypothetical protein
MKVICDNCGAMYQIPDEKLVKPVNKATCRQCGHRMLIPRPRRGADPDERTLVTSVPPTPSPPPLRGHMRGPATTPLHEDERTMPTGARVDQTRWVRNELPGNADALSAQPSLAPRQSHLAAVTLNPLSGSAPTERVPAHGGAGSASIKLTAQPASQQRPDRSQAAPPSAPAPPPAPGLEAKVTEAMIDDKPEVEPPSRKKSKRNKSAKHDPSGDLGLALMGTLVALLGIGLLGITSVIDAAGVMYWPMMLTSLIATAVSVGATVTTVMVLLTGSRGRKPAKKGLAVVLGIVAALLLGGWPVAGRVVMDSSTSTVAAFNEFMASSRPMSGTLHPKPVPPPADPTVGAEGDVPAPDAGLPDEAVGDGTADDLVPPPVDGVADVVDPGASDGGTSTTEANNGTAERSTQNRVTPRDNGRSRVISAPPADPVPRTEPTDAEELDLEGFGLEDETPAAVKSNLPATPPLAAIDVLIKSNVKVKKCFYDEGRRAGALPDKVDMRLTIKANGDATGISMRQKKFQGSDLEGCLIRAVRGISFPTSQDGTTLTFPFVLK